MNPITFQHPIVLLLLTQPFVNVNNLQTVSKCTFGYACVNRINLGPQVLGSPRGGGGGVGYKNPRPRPFFKYDLPDVCKSLCHRLCGGRRLSTSHVPRNSSIMLKLPTIPLSLPGTSSKVAPGQQATLSVSRAGNSRICESPAISMLIGWSGPRLVPRLVPGVATLCKHTSYVLIR